MSNEFSTIELLQRQKAALRAEIDKIDLALAVLIKAAPQPGSRRNANLAPQWSPSIDRLFEQEGREMDFQQVRKGLISLGLRQAEEPAYRGSILACLARKVKQGKLERVRTGVYRRKPAGGLPPEPQNTEVHSAFPALTESIASTPDRRFPTAS